MITPNKSGQLTLPTVRLVLGIVAIVLSLMFSIEFVSAGSSGGAIIGAILFCLITEFCKVVFAGDLFYYWETGQGSKTLFSAVIVAILFALSISAAVFCLTIAPAKNEAIVSQSDSRVQNLEKAIADKKAQIAACNQAYLSKCVNPRTAELNALQSELSEITKQSDSLTDAKAQAAFWAKAAEYLGTNPNSLQMNFAIARAVLLDLLGLILISQYTASRRVKAQFENDETTQLIDYIEQNGYPYYRVHAGNKAPNENDLYWSPGERDLVKKFAADNPENRIAKESALLAEIAELKRQLEKKQ